MANKKINQLVSKTAILSTDIFGIGDATTGQLFKKTIAELQAAIGGAVISVNGLVGTVVLDTDDIQELATPTNKYFTDARARGAISLTVTGNSGASTYSSGTGVLNVPTYTLAGLGGITASFLSGTSGISYNSTTGVISYSGTVYTDASIRALLSGSTGISYNSTTGAISYSGTVYTDSSVRALISLTTTGTSGASTFNNTTGVINVPEYTLAGLGGISLTSLSGGTGITYNNTTGAISYSGTVYTDASVRALISASGNVSYNNTTGVISLTSGNLTEATSSVLTITGGTGAVLGSGTSIQVKQATTSVSGFLSSTDWTTFNNKANALSGTTNYIAKFTSSTGIGNSSIIDTANTYIQINKNGSSITAPIFQIVPTTTTNSSLMQLDNAGAGTLYIGRQNSVGNSDLIGSLGAYASVLGHTGTQTLHLITNSLSRLSVDGSGNVGIGTSSPFGSSAERTIHLSDAGGGNATMYVTNSANTVKTILGMQSSNAIGLVGMQSNNPFIIVTNDTERMRITAAGNVGVGTSNPLDKFHIQESSTTGVIRLGGGNGAGNARMYFYSHSTDAYIDMYGNNGYLPLKIYGNPLSLMGGNVLINTTTNNGENLYVSGTIRATSTITANSDIRIKSNITKIENALEKVGQISGYTYNTNYDDKRHGGVIAQEIDKVFPEIVNTGNDGLMGVEYGNISALLIEAIKEQNIKIKNLETLLASK